MSYDIMRRNASSTAMLNEARRTCGAVASTRSTVNRMPEPASPSNHQRVTISDADDIDPLVDQQVGTRMRPVHSCCT